MLPTKTTNVTRRTTRTKADNLPKKPVSTHDSRSTKPPSKAGASPLTTEDERTTCMRSVNASLQTLSDTTKSGSKVVEATRTAKKALERLRVITPNDLDVERAACSMTGKLITLELYGEAIQVLGAMYPRLLGIAAKRGNVPEKTWDALLTKAYTFVNKVCTALSSNADPKSIFYLRINALSCLLYTSPGTIKSATFWDQVHKACLSYARTFTSERGEEEKEPVFAASVSRRLSEAVELAQALCDRSFLEGRSFVQMCEAWMNFAKKGDISTLDHISALMGIPSSSSSSRTNLDALCSAPLSTSFSVDSLANRMGGLKLSESTSTKDDVLVGCAQCCGIFVKATAGLDTEGPELARHVNEASGAVRRYCKLISNIDSLISPDSTTSVPDATSHTLTDPELERARGKLERALERLRRAGLRVLDAPQVQNQDTRQATTSLLEAITTALEGSLAHVRQRAEVRSTLTSLVDVLFALARSRLDPANVDSYTPALSHLEHATAAVNASMTGAITNDDAATLFRCISGALHNLGGTLYTANRLGGAVRFLKEGCVLGRRVLGMYQVGQDVDQSERGKEGRQQLEEQLFRRYELLGVCHSKIGDRKLAYECFVESVWTFPYVHYRETLVSADSFGSGASLALKQLSSIVERLTYAATCELFLPPAQISLRSLGHSDTDPDTESTPRDSISTFPPEGRARAEIAGAILTLQLATLESIGHKDGAREAMEYILQDLLEMYDASWAPIQRARVLITALGVSWRDGVDVSTSSVDVDQMGTEALALLSKETPESETLASLVPQLTTSAHMWLALHAYRQSPPGVEMMHAVAKHVEAAYDVLWGLFPGSGVESKGLQPSPSPRGKLVVNAARNNANAAAKKGWMGTKNKKPAADASKSQPRKALGAVSLNTGEPTPCNTVAAKAATIFDLQSILGLIQMNVHLLGLLGLIVLKVKLLEVLKRICEHHFSNSAEAYSVICVDLAHEYMTLGKSKRASALFNKCANVLKMGDVPDEVRLLYLLGRAEVFALGGNVAASASAYRDAQSLEATIEEDKTMPTARRIRARVERLERAALACRVFAAVQYAKDNVVGALCSMLQSLRLWNRAIDALSRLSPPTSISTAPQPPDDDANPFEVPANANANPDLPPLSTPRSKPSTSTPTSALAWRLLTHLTSTLFSLAHTYHTRGSPRESLFFIHQALDLAESTRAPAVVARACLLRGEVLLGMGMGHLGEGREAVERAGGMVVGVLGIDAADGERLRGDYGVREEGYREGREHGYEEGEGDPGEHYERACKMLDELEQRIVSFDGGRRKSSLDPMGMMVQGGQGMVVPKLLSAILRRQIWLLRDDGGNVLKDSVDRLMALPPSAEIKGEEHAIMGKLTLHSVYEQFRSDMFLSSLTESTIALPMGMSCDKRALVPAMQDILSALNDAERLFWADLALMSRRGTVPHVREASVSLAIIRALQSSLGKASGDAPLLVARLLDASSAITLHREMLEAIPYKYGDVPVDDLQWPLMTTDESPVPRTTVDGDESDRQRAYWSALENKYTSLVFSPASLVETMTKLPDNWTVIHLTLTPDKSSMFISRLHTASSQPLLFCVPLRGRRDTEEEEERLGLEDALHEMREIVRLSDEGTRRAAHVRSDDLEARAGWWAERAALDKRLQTLLENIEFCWLGAFKTILSPPTRVPSEVIGDLRTRLERVIKRSLPPGEKKKLKVRLDDALVGCFSSLSPKCRDEELEDLAYFMLDLYQLHGVAIAISEVDMDQVTVDLRAVLEEHAGVRKKANVMAVEDSHTFLIVDRSLQGIPWESVPVLREQSVSRIPSMEFLVDRMRLVAMGSGDGCVDRVRVDKRKAYYVLNPSGDLKGTEERFGPWLRGKGWEGIVGRAPSEQEMLNALSRKDLVIYFGHGGGEQYVRSHKIRHLSRCAATMLWGCSSGALREMGEYDRVGTPYNYMVAGCPTLVANLWDVTDRDIDKFTQGVFDELEAGSTVVRAVARSRERCKLRYLTGSAPVVYGIPFYLG